MLKSGASFEKQTGVLEGTTLQTLAKPKRVEDINSDEFVLAPDDTYRRVDSIIEGTTDVSYDLVSTEGKLAVAADCPLLVRGTYKIESGKQYFPPSWVKAKEIKKGDLIYSLSTQSWVQILSLEKVRSDHTKKVYTVKLRNGDSYCANGMAIGNVGNSRKRSW